MAIEAHPAARTMPLLTGDDFEQLKSSLEEYGFIASYPVITYQGMVLDGRNRLRACEELGITPVCREWDGEWGDPWTFVFATNIVRRHLSDGNKIRLALKFEAEIAKVNAEKQKAQGHKGGKTAGKGRPKQAIAFAPNGAKAMEPAKHRSEDTSTDAQLAKAAGMSKRSFQRGKKIAKQAPDLFEAVEAGKMSFAAAERELKARVEPNEPSKPEGEPSPREDIVKRIGRSVRATLRKYPDHRGAIIEALKAEVRGLQKS